MNEERMEKITEAVGKIKDEYIEEVSAERERETLRLAAEQKARKSRLIKLSVAACAAVALTLWAVVSARLPIHNPGKNDPAPHSTSKPSNGNHSDESSDKPSDDSKDDPKPAKPPESSAVKPLKAVSYPERLEYPDFDTSYYNDNELYNEYQLKYSYWQHENRERRESAKDTSVSRKFYKNTIRTILSANDNENTVYSPMSLYLALSMLAECTDSESRQEILSLLDVKSINSLRNSASVLWKSNYRLDKTTQSMLASSIWMDKSIKFKKDTIDTLANSYYAECFREKLSDPETKEKIAAWINSRTGGLLEEAADKIQPENSIFLIYSTLYFKGRWMDEFNPKNNESRVFHSPNGDITAEFMYQYKMYGPYYYGEDYAAVCQQFSQGGNMWFILPDEDKSINEVLESGEYLDMIAEAGNTSINDTWKKQKRMIVELYLPKFDISSDSNLSDSLKALGMESVFSLDKADFTPLTSNDAYLDKVRQAARVTIDEEGCTAAAFTEEALCGAAAPPKDMIELVLDRPFIYVIQSDTGEILFTGTVYNPN